MVYGVECDGEGRAKLTLPGTKAPTAKQAFARRCYLNGIGDADEAAALWAAEVAKRESQKSSARNGKPSAREAASARHAKRRSRQ